MINDNVPHGDLKKSTMGMEDFEACKHCIVKELRELRQQQSLHERRMERLLQVHESRIIGAVMPGQQRPPNPSPEKYEVPDERDFLGTQFVSVYQQTKGCDVTPGGPDGCGAEASPTTPKEVPNTALTHNGSQDSADRVSNTGNEMRWPRRSFSKDRPNSEQSVDGTSPTSPKPSFVGITTPTNEQRGSVSEMVQELKRASISPTMSFDHLKLEGSKEQQTGIRNNLQSLLKNKRCDYFVGFMIIFNAVVIGVQTDFALTHRGNAEPPSFRILDLLFTSFFAIELLMRIIAEGCLFLSCWNKNAAWNVLDSFIVASALTEELFTLASDSGEAPDMSTMRLLRILRLVRVCRVIRVMKLFRELRLMVYGILSVGKSLIWSLLLLLLIMFIFACSVMQVMASELDAGAHFDDEEELFSFFGSMLLSVYVLHKSIFGGVDWGRVSDHLNEISPALVFLFMVYISFSMLCVLNIITAVFIENANKITLKDEQHVITEELNARQTWVEEVQKLFQRADVNRTGALDCETFAAYVKDVRVQALCRKLGLDIDSMNSTGLFHLLDLDSNGKVDMDEFVLGVQQISGNAKSLHIAQLRHENKKVQAQIAGLKKLCASHFERQAMHF